MSDNSTGVGAYQVHKRELPITGEKESVLREVRENIAFWRDFSSGLVVLLWVTVLFVIYQTVTEQQVSPRYFYLACVIIGYVVFKHLTFHRANLAERSWLLTECDDVGVLQQMAELANQLDGVRREMNFIIERSGRQRLYWYEVCSLLLLADREKDGSDLYKARQAVLSAARRDKDDV